MVDTSTWESGVITSTATPGKYSYKYRVRINGETVNLEIDQYRGLDVREPSVGDRIAFVRFHIGETLYTAGWYFVED